MLGDTVNTSSRMESNGFPMRVHMSGVAANALRVQDPDLAGYLAERNPPISVKGKGTMQTFWLNAPDLPKVHIEEEAPANTRKSVYMRMNSRRSQHIPSTNGVRASPKMSTTDAGEVVVHIPNEGSDIGSGGELHTPAKTPDAKKRASRFSRAVPAVSEANSTAPKTPAALPSPTDPSGKRVGFEV